MARWTRALALGLAFGLAAALGELTLVAVGTLERRMGGGAQPLLQIAALQTGLCVLLGVLGAPLLRLRRGAPLWVLAMAFALLALGWWVRFEAPMGRVFWLAPPVGAAVLTLAGLALARRRPALPWALGVLLLALVVIGPGAYIDATSPPTAPRAALPPAPPGAPDVVLVVLDTVRAESVSTYGYTRETAPTFHALAQEGALFLDATSPSTWSLPSHASLFTGRYPSSHGAHAENHFLDDRYPTLAQVLASVGYETFCFTSNAWISDGLGLTRGFSHQDSTWREKAGAGRNFSFVNRLLDRLGLVSGDKGGASVAANFAAWMGARPPEARPAFVFLNFIEAHFPYHQLPDEYASRFTDRPKGELEEISMALMGQQFGGPGYDGDARGPARDLYDGGVLYSDELLRRVVEALRERGRLDRTVLVVLADHGELLGERGGFYGHGPSMYQPMVRVPLLLRFPPAVPAGARVTTPVSTVGVFASVLDLAGIEAPPTLHVATLLPLARGENATPGPILSELMIFDMAEGVDPLPDPQMRGDARLRLYRSGSWKLVETSRGESFLYDLASDPGEERELAARRPEELARLRAELATAAAQLGLPALEGPLPTGDAAPELDPATRERLRELGYVE